MSQSEVGCPATDRTNDSEVSATPDKMALSPPPICGLERAPSPGKYMPQACVSKAGVARCGAATPWGWCDVWRPGRAGVVVSAFCTEPGHD